MCLKIQLNLLRFYWRKEFSHWNCPEQQGSSLGRGGAGLGQSWSTQALQEGHTQEILGVQDTKEGQ